MKKETSTAFLMTNNQWFKQSLKGYFQTLFLTKHYVPRIQLGTSDLKFRCLNTAPSPTTEQFSNFRHVIGHACKQDALENASA